MWLIPLILVPVAIWMFLWFWSHKGHRAIARGFRTLGAVDAIMDAYKQGDYSTALENVERLKSGISKSAEYCFFRGSMLYHSGKFEEAEASLREGMRLEEDPRQKALAYSTLATVLMEQGRYPEAIGFFENAGRAWPGRGANHRGIAEVWLRQGREFPEALQHARQALEIDRQASGMRRDALDSRLGENLGVLAWAVAANSGDIAEVESLLKEAFPLLDPKTKPVLAEFHYHVGRAYSALNRREKSAEHFRQATELDPQGIFGKLARAAIA
jgi:tetratricopeptide (TPR) repeat protein